METKFTRRMLMGTAGAFSGAVLFAACATGGAMAPADDAPAMEDKGEADDMKEMGPSEVKFWTYQDFLLEGHIGNDLLLEFQEANPNVDLALTPTHIGSGSKEKLITAAAAGAPPDVFYMDRYLAGQLSAPGFLLNLNDHIKATAAFSWDDIWPKLRDDCTWKGNIYGVGLHTDARTYMFNVDHFLEVGLDPENPPATWDEVESATLKLHKAGQDGVIERLGYSTGPPGNPPVGLQWYIHFWQQGGEYLSPDNKMVNFDNEMGVTALKFMINMVDLCGGNVRIDEFLGQQRPDRNDAFTTGGVSQMIGGHWYAATYRKAWESAVNFKSAPMPLPPDGIKTNYQGGWALAQPQGAANADGGFSLIEFFLGGDVNLRWSVGAGDYIPALQSASFGGYLEQVPEAEAYLAELELAKWVPVIPGNDEIIGINIDIWFRAYAKEITPEEANKEHADRVQEVLNKWADQL